MFTGKQFGLLGNFHNVRNKKFLDFKARDGWIYFVGAPPLRELRIEGTPQIADFGRNNLGVVRVVVFFWWILAGSQNVHSWLLERGIVWYCYGVTLFGGGE